MNKIPDNLKYTESHEWVRIEENGTITIGITDHAQEELGDLVYVELPKIGQQLNLDEVVGVVESVKAAEDLYSPLAGEVIDFNAELEDAPELLNNDPYGSGWLFKLKLAENSHLENLLGADEYAKFIAKDK
ncbi:MAG: glycine cleavage system protein GcvH [Gammaproteobacteria bacterium]|nr:MAG: glycine cleavage system protein GcvH [Gammaproteobacteria bacterium]RKZ43683.1 MAG: glycine cleavage system protein GcvH [Gammaproteobacteria bacterium]RKZ74443.1 MAG: glycine cleavage system protein GcvH [Gammaproteobacteria bacterium]